MAAPEIPITSVPTWKSRTVLAAFGSSALTIQNWSAPAPPDNRLPPPKPTKNLALFCHSPKTNIKDNFPNSYWG